MNSHRLKHSSLVLQGVHVKLQTQPLNNGKNNKNQSNRLEVFNWATEEAATAGGLAAVVVQRGVTETGIAPAAMRSCLLRRVNASSATRLNLPLAGMEVPEPVMEVS